MGTFDEIVERIPNKFTIDELIEIYNSGIFLACVGDQLGDIYGAAFPTFDVSRYLCNAVVMYYAMRYYCEKNDIVIDADVLRAQIAQIDSGVDTAFLVLRDLEAFLDEMFCELRAARRKTDIRSTTVVEQLIAGAGIDYQSRISDNGESSSIVYPNRGDSTTESVICYGVDAVLDWDYDEIHGNDDFDTRVWLLHRIKELNPNFVLDYTWY